VSAALGELRQALPVPASAVAYAKWGPSGLLAQAGWRRQLAEAADRLRRALPGCRPVAVSYADWQKACAPRPTEVCAFACDRHWGAFLLDTWEKNGAHLLDWLNVCEIGRLIDVCRAAGLPVALAGSLGLEQIRRLQELEPAWFAVRGAVCRWGRRTGAIDVNRIRDLVERLRAPARPATPGN
jgi:uncharacterized protein (UPF0264 family)